MSTPTTAPAFVVSTDPFFDYEVGEWCCYSTTTDRYYFGISDADAERRRDSAEAVYRAHMARCPGDAPVERPRVVIRVPQPQHVQAGV